MAYVKFFDIEMNIAGARSGPGHYKSNAFAPFMIATPSQWDKTDFNTHSTQRHIWTEEEVEG